MEIEKIKEANQFLILKFKYQSHLVMIAAINKHTKIPKGSQVNSQSKQVIRKGSMSILDKIKASKNIDLQTIDISHKTTKSLITSNNNAFHHVKIQDVLDKQTIFKNKSNLVNFPESITYHEKFLQQGKTNTILKEKENIKHTPFKNKSINTKQSLTEKVTPQKLIKKHNQSQSSSRMPRHPLAQLSVHEQLYIDSKKKEIKKSTQLIIQNEYFKKKHPFKPHIGEVSEFLAEQRYQKIKQRQQFERQFQNFNDWKQELRQTQSGAKSAKTHKKNLVQLQKQTLNKEKQTELKNYTMLRQFFFYLTGSQNQLCFNHLSSKKLLQFPSPMINFLSPIIEVFYKNTHKHSLSWIQFLSEFNLKVDKRKAFYKLIEKWFLVKFGVTFEGATMHETSTQNRKKENIVKKDCKIRDFHDHTLS